MDIPLFLISAAGFTLIPGPNATLIAASSLSHGTRKGLQCALGVSVGIAVHLIIALLSTRWVLKFITQDINWPLWVLALALLYFGVRTLFARFKTAESAHLSGSMSFARGLGISLANPKGIIFFATFIPLFIDKSQSYWPQAVLLASLFLVVALCGDILYAVFAGKISKLIHSAVVRKFLRKHKRLASLRFKGWFARW